MSILRLNEACLAYGDTALLDQVNFSIKEGQKLGLVGRNGMGKSSFMKVLAGVEKLDSGSLTIEKDINVQYLPQDLPPADETTVFDYLSQGLAALGALLSEYEHLTQQALDDSAMRRLEVLQTEIEVQDGWSIQQKIHASLKDLGVAPETTMKTLSGGWRRRLSIAKALLSDPDLILLDEPTNHLDIPAINALQEQLQRCTCAVMFITHDRRFLGEVAQEILWLDRGKLLAFPGDYDKFLEGRDAYLANEAKQNALFDKRLAEEEKWIRQGIKARRTRNEGRVRALKAMRNERKQRVDVKGNVKMQIDASQKSSKLVAELKGVSFSYEDRDILKPFSLTIQRGDRIGIIGKNGVGKSTLVKLILGQLEPDTGTVRLGENQKIAYFDQTRDQLIEEKSVADNLAEGREAIEINGKQKHVISYLGDFLFPPQRVRGPVSALSGGEKNRLMLAKLFSKQANILVLDEPTNDLDIETLELLEELIADFEGTVIVISHDREFVDQIVTSTLFITDNGRVSGYVGGYDDLLRQHGNLWDAPSAVEEETPQTSKTDEVAKPAVQEKKKKLSYKDQRELDALPKLIEELESEIEADEAIVAEGDFYQRPHDEVSAFLESLGSKQEKLESYYARWEALESE